VKLWNAFVNAPGKVLIALAKFVSPFKVTNQYVRKVYRNNINLFRIHLALSLIVMAGPVLITLVFLLSLAGCKATIDFFSEVASDLYYEAKSVFKPIVRGFKEGLPRD
jgi:hypothetical protein